MADPFVAEIRIFGFNFAPSGWARCDGQLLPISQNTALFSLLGTQYGGDGKSTFALPDLQGAAPLHADGSNYFVGQPGGQESVELLPTEIPAHTHALQASTDPADVTAPTPARSLAIPDGGHGYGTPSAGPGTMDASALAPAGGSQPHTNMQPYLTALFCIALQGVFPPRS
jgi:microcystin-dependent protein